MTEPLDFTKAGRERAAAAAPAPPAPPSKAPRQPKAPKRPRAGRDSPNKLDPAWKSRGLIALVVVAVLVIGFLVVRSRHGTSARVAAVNQARYCELSVQFEAVASSVGASPRTGSFDGPPAAMADLVKQMGPTLSEMQSDAPAKVRDDVNTVISAVEKAAKGDRSGVVTPAFAVAQQHLSTYQGSTCSSGAASGDG